MQSQLFFVFFVKHVAIWSQRYAMEVPGFEPTTLPSPPPLGNTETALIYNINDLVQYRLSRC